MQGIVPQCNFPRNFLYPTTHLVANAERCWQGRVLHLFNTKRRRFSITSVAGDRVTRSGTTARERRMVKLTEVRKQREEKREQRKKMYPKWAQFLEEASKSDDELREIIGDAFGNPELMMKRLRERRLKKHNDILNPKSGSMLAVNVIFKDINPSNLYVWIELHGNPSDKDVQLIGRTVRSWYVLGRLGAFNSANLQLTALGFHQKLSYSLAKASGVLPSALHDISDLEFQENLGRFWVDMGTTDALALDVLISSFVTLSSSHIGVKHLVFGSERFGDWEHGMTSVEYGYKSFKI